MPYISSDKVKIIREQIKAALPGYKFSVRREHYMSVQICIMQGPMDFKMAPDRTSEQVNTFHYRSHYQDRPEIVQVFDTIMSIANQFLGKGYEDGDYGHVPTYYVRLNIGNWIKGYKQV